MSRQITGVSDQLIPQGSSFRGGEDGSITYIERFALADKSQLPTLIPQIGVTVHPDDSNARCSAVAGEYDQESGVYLLTVEYKTPDGTGWIDIGSKNGGRSVEIIAAVQTEPIETHPDFATLAGTAASPANGAIYDDDGRFTGWAATSAYRGIESYLAPTVRVRIAEVDTVDVTSADLEEIGTIQSVSASDAPTPSGYNWLCTDVSQVDQGDDYLITREYTLSGPSGWNTDIYAP